MRALGIDTATSIASVGIVADGCTAAERSLPMAGSHARTLLAVIEAVLAAAAVRLTDVGLLAVSIGPGSFTGLRIGLSVAKGLVLATGAPIVGVPTLEAYARAAGPRAGAVWPVLDARKGEVYAAGFDWRDGALGAIAEPLAIAPGALVERLRPPCTLLGDGVDAYEDLWRQRLGAGATLLRLAARPPSGAVIAALGAERAERSGTDDLARLEPVYCRQSEAELHRGRRVAHAAAV